MTDLERAREIFTKDFPQTEWLESFKVDGYECAFLLKSPQGQTCIFTEIPCLVGPNAYCRTAIYNKAVSDDIHLLIQYQRKTYWFRLADIYNSQPKHDVQNGEAIMKFPIRLGINVKTLNHPTTKAVIKDFGAKVVTGSLFETPSSTAT